MKGYTFTIEGKKKLKDVSRKKKEIANGQWKYISTNKAEYNVYRKALFSFFQFYGKLQDNVGKMATRNLANKKCFTAFTEITIR